MEPSPDVRPGLGEGAKSGSGLGAGRTGCVRAGGAKSVGRTGCNQSDVYSPFAIKWEFDKMGIWTKTENKHFATKMGIR